jgi:hypothetical protein
MFPDTYILESRAHVVRGLPWPLPACVLMRMTDEDLDHLAAVDSPDAYWSTLNLIVRRIECQSTNVEKPDEGAA